MPIFAVTTSTGFCDHFYSRHPVNDAKHHPTPSATTVSVSVQFILNFFFLLVSQKIKRARKRSKKCLCKKKGKLKIGQSKCDKWNNKMKTGCGVF